MLKPIVDTAAYVRNTNFINSMDDRLSFFLGGDLPQKIELEQRAKFLYHILKVVIEKSTGP